MSALPGMSSYYNNPTLVCPITLIPQELQSISTYTHPAVPPEKISVGETLVNLLVAFDLVPELNTSFHLSWSPITGGITNTLFLLAITSQDSTTAKTRNYILRVFGNGTEAFIDRSSENKVFSVLSANNLGPALFGVFLNGRVEGHLTNMRCLSPPEMHESSIYREVAKSVQRLHSVQIPSIAPETSGKWLWQTTHKFMDLAAQLDFSDNDNKMKTYKSLHIEDVMRKELIWLEAKINSVCRSEHDGKGIGRSIALENVLCHNDLLSGNIMRSVNGDGAEGITIVLIDYEYAAYNYRAYDFANHFCGSFCPHLLCTN